MKIWVKRLDGEKKPLEVNPECRLEELKKTLGEKVGVAPSQIRLVFKGAPLKDDQTLVEQKVAAEDVVHMILQLNGGTSHPSHSLP